MASNPPLRRRRPGIREVAERAGVAISSVSRVLSDHPDVSDDMRERVMKAVQDLAYQPDALAQSLRRQCTMSVGFVAATIANPILAETVIGAEVQLRTAGYRLLLTDSDRDPEVEAQNILLLEQRRVDGLLLSLSDEQHPAVLGVLADLELPVVFIDRDPPPGPDAKVVTFDHRGGMRAAAQHLHELGHREVAVIVGGPRRPARERLQGVVDVFGDACETLEGEFSIRHGEAAMEKLLRRPTPPTAVIACGNLYMHGALRVLRDAGVRLGRDLSFVGCDDVAVAEFHDPPIAVVRREARSSGTSGADLLLGQMMGNGVPDSVVLPTEFVPQASCAPPPGRRRTATSRRARA